MPVALGQLAEEVFEQVAPLGTRDAENGHVLAHLTAALNGPIEEVASWVRDDDASGRPGYAVVVDVDTAPAILLPWLGQFRGVQVTPGLTEAQQRDEVRAATGMRRGSPDALAAATAAHLTGNRTVRVLTRVGGDMYAVTVITRTAETPNPALTLQDAMAAKRIGVILTHVVTDAPLIDEGTRTIDAATGTIDTATIADIT